MGKREGGEDQVLALLPQIFDHYPDAALVLRLVEEQGRAVDYIYVYANQPATQIMNAPLEAFVGKGHNQYFGMADPNIPLYHRAVREGKSGQRWLYNPEIEDFTEVSYCKVGQDLCLVTGHFIDRSLMDAQETLAASMNAFDMIISVNLSRGVYHMISYDNYHNQTAKDHGAFDTLIAVGADTLPEHWREPFLQAFSREKQLAAFAAGQRIISLDHQQYSQDGSLHWVRTQAIRIENRMTRDVMQVTTATLIDDLKAQEEKMRLERQAVYDTLPGSVVHCRVEGQLPLLRWNQGFAQLVGLDTPAPKGYLSVVHPEDREQVRRAMYGQAQKGEMVDITCRVMDRAGRAHWMHQVGRPLQREGEAPEYFLLGFDITQQKEQAEALDAERRRYKALYDTAPCAIVEYLETPDGALLRPACNPETRRLMGCYGQEEAFHRRCQAKRWQVSDITGGPEDAQIYWEHSRRLREPGDVVRFESKRRCCGTGRIMRVFGTLELLAAYPDGSRRIRNMYFDIEEQKQAEEEIQKRQRRYERLLNSISCAYLEYQIMQDGTSRFREVNTEAARLFGAGKEALLASRDFRSGQTILPEDLPAWWRAHHQAMEHPGRQVDYVVRIMPMGGQPCWVAGYVTCLHDADGCPYIQSVFLNIDAQMRQEEAKRQAQADLALKSETLRVALNNANLSYVYYDPKKEKFEVDEGAFARLGRGAQCDGSIDSVLEALVAPEHRQAVRQAYDRAAAGEEQVQVEYRLNQTRSWWRTRLSVVRRGEDGRPGMIVGFLSDITKEYNQSVEMQENLNAIANTYGYIHRVHLPSRTVTAIRQSEWLDQLIGRHGGVQETLDVLAREAAPFHMRQEVLSFLDPDRVAAALGPQHISEGRAFCLRTADGAMRWMQINLILSALRQGKVESYLIASRDISQEKKNEERALRATQERNEMSDAISAMFFSAFAADLEAETYRVIKRAAGCNAQLPAQGPFHLLIDSHLTYLTPQDGARIKELFSLNRLRSTLSAANPVTTVELPAAIEDGSLWLRISMVLTQLKEGKPARAALIMQDVTVEREQELEKQEALRVAFQSARQANEAKSSFLSRMSHDIRTPLNAVIGMTSIAEASAENPQRVRDCLGKISRSSQHLLNLINEVLDMSRIESGQIQLVEEAFTLGDLVDDLVAIIRPQAQEKDQKLRVRIGALCQEEVVGDMRRLQQCCLNFLSNAVKYTPQGGEITISLAQKPSRQPGRACYEMAFSDNGYGMSPSFIPHIFEPFAREEDSRISKIQGTGLGMAIADSIIRMMGGSIQVWSQPNQGSCFTVTFYLKTRVQPAVDMRGLEGRRALVVDRDEGRADALRHTLKEAGLSCAWCESIDDLPQEEQWDAVILDHEGVGEDWQGALSSLRKRLGEGPNVLLLWEGDWSDAEAQARRAGANAILSKPVFRSRLLQSLRSMLDAQAETQAAPPPFRQLAQADYSGRRFLLVEDNEINLEIAQDLLAMTGARLECAEDGRQALSKVAASPEGYYDLILMDVQMPVMDGYQATRAIRALPRQDVKKMPIFAMTANAFAEDVEMSRRAGMDEHVAKPLDLTLLRDLLSKWLG